MASTVIFVDGEHVRKIFGKANLRVNIPKVVKKILELSKIDENDLLRVYFYTSPPYQSSYPTVDEKERYIAFQRFEAFLKKQDNFEIKLGRTEKRGNDFEQKMVDVLLSIDLVELSAKGNIATAILVAGDSDFIPAVAAAKESGATVSIWYGEENSIHDDLFSLADITNKIDFKKIPGKKLKAVKRNSQLPKIKKTQSKPTKHHKAKS